MAAVDFERHDMNLKRIYTLWFLSTWSVNFGDNNWSAQRREIRNEAEIACSPNLSNHHWWMDLDNIKRTTFIVCSIAWLWLYEWALGREQSDGGTRACRVMGRIMISIPISASRNCIRASSDDYLDVSQLLSQRVQGVSFYDFYNNFLCGLMLLFFI